MFSINFEQKNQSDLLFRKLIISLFLLIIPAGILAQNGVIKSYYPDRTPKSELSYVNDILDGPAKFYHENGKAKLEKNYSRGILNGWVREYFLNGNLKEEYSVKTGVLDGDKKEFAENGQLLKIFSYTDGILLNRQNFDAESPAALVASKEVTEPEVKKEIVEEKVKPVEIKEDVITQAYPVGGTETIQTKIIYPEHAQKFGLEGKVELLVTIDESGTPVNVIVKKGIGLGCDEAAINAVKQSKFVASTKNGVPVQSELPVTLEFKLPKVKETIVEVKQEEKTVAEAKPARKFEEHLSVICEADRCPRPEDDLETIYSRFEVPTVAKALKLRGMIIIEGFVDKDGNLKQTKIVEGIGYGCDQLVENSLLKSKFTPATKKGEPVDANIVLSFPFSYER